MTFPIVGIGASAGGLEAVSELLAALPSKSGVAFILVQHLDPDHESLLTELLAKRATMPVRQAEEGLAIEPDHVYVIPPNATLTVSDQRLRLVARPSAPARHMPADALLKSLAADRGDASIGVILSGGDSDGALGIEAIKHEGGITFAQEPTHARFPSMPRSAIETGCVDFVLRPREIARELVRLVRHPYLRTLSRPVAPAESEESGEIVGVGEEEQLRRVFRRLRVAHGADFTHYKRSTLRRRMARRMALQKIDDAAEYVALIERDPTEAATLYQDFLIRVTGFFRDPDSFEGLRERVFPSLCEGRSAKNPIRIWVPGCATGEEVYSIAMTLVEYLGERHMPEAIQVFGTDLSETAIEKARAGVYLENIVQEVSSERLARFFVKQDDHYRIAKTIRDLCIFARQDVTRDPPFSRLDLVSCRNLLIYLDASAQRRIMQVFHYALHPQGFLMLGPSESVGQASDLFELTDKHLRIYTRRTTPPGAVVDLGRGTGTTYTRPREATEDVGTDVEADSAQREADRLLLARFAPASVLVDEELNILQFRGETGPYLEHASGPPSLNLHRVARPELLVEITPAIQEARESGAEVRREGLCIDERRDIAIAVIPLKRLSAERCYLILFEDGTRPPSGRRAQPSVPSTLPESEKDRRLVQSEREVASIRDYLQATMEEHEAVKEELKSAHEEVLSANEEFQSTNEELETSKEELQSANEELTTTNDELRNRNRELSVLNSELEKTRAASERAREYADAIIETVREPLLVLEGDLKVLRANHAFYVDFRLAPAQTEGHPLYELGNGQWNVAELRERLTDVLTRNKTMIECEIEISTDFPVAARRALSLSGRKIAGDGERTDLILLAIEDVTDRRASRSALIEESRRKDDFLAMLAHELRNPLAPIVHALQLLRPLTTNPAATKLNQMIERQSHRLVRLVDDLLDVARVSRGLITLRRERVELTTLARQVAEASRARMVEREHELTLSLPEGPMYIHGDPVRIDQVIANLLDNASKYTQRGGRIQLTLVQESNDAVFSVRDNGIGLAPETLETVFEPFTQVDRALARSTAGLGLGLSVARRLLQLHGGRIEAHSAGLGHGSEFVVRLPLAVAASDNSQSEQPEALPAKLAVPRRVLIVDDNADSAQSLALLVRHWGHEVAVARDAREALARAETLEPDVALVDIGMPGVDGHELARRLRAQPRYRDALLVAVTGYGRAEDRDAAHRAGFDAYLVKPADSAELAKLLAGARKGPK
ncbi:MAG: response regulator [Gammaproteobacteria bacterium]|nr:response regulator [Gammaproteobacteria bacterium]